MSAPVYNRDVFENDPTENSLQNDGVSKVTNAAALRYELKTFVCEGEYELGLHRILDTYLSHLSLPTQPSAWVSGFYGSGKSHLVKIIEALWSNTPFSDGQHPRDIARLPTEIRQSLLQLSNEAKRAGGLWSASGMLSESGNLSVRMLLLGIVYKAAGLSSNYGRARFRLWVRQRGWEDEIIKRIVAAGLDPDEEFEQYLVSPEIADAVWELSGTKSADAESIQENWAAQFNRDDVTIDEMEAALKDVLKLQSTDGKQLPLTLIVLDEVQQYIGESGARAQAVQEAVERIQTAFESKVLVVATGQASLNSTANLQKLQGRFTVNVMLSDKDVENVVREVVLRKDPTHLSDVQALVARVEGEIDRHLQGTKISPRSEDKTILAADYPLLPTRNRFWAKLLHELDPTGTSGQLRTQLRVIHGATVHVADKSLGHVIPADFIYDQLHGGLQQTGALPRDVSNMIADQDDDTADGKLRARLVQLIFLIEQLPSGDINDAGVKATPDNLADLLVENLLEGSDSLRQRIPQLLKGLEDDGKLMRAADGSYAIQTGESLKWQQHYQQERQSLVSNPGPLGQIRSLTIEKIIREQTKSVRRTHGVTNTPRDFVFQFGNETPKLASGDSKVVVWVRDGWSSSQSTVVRDAREAGDSSPIVYVFIPQREQQELQAALANYEAAKRTLDMRGASQDTTEGQRAAASVRIRMEVNERRFTSMLTDVVRDAAVYQGGGAEVDGTTFKDKLQTAFESSLKRLFPSFAVGDHPEWDKVFTRAVQGNAEALKAVGHAGDDGDHMVVREIRKQIPGAQGVSWSAVRKTFESAPYGWPRDTIDGAVAVLVSSGLVSARRGDAEIRGKDLVKQQANATTLATEGVVVTKPEWLAARKPFILLDGAQPTDDYVRAEARNLVHRLIDLVAQAGGEPPKPLEQLPPYLTDLRHQTGNQLVKSLAAHAVQLEADIKKWQAQADLIKHRMGAWELTEELARHAERLEAFAGIRAKLDAIRDNRQLLGNPDPLPPVADDLANALREAVTERIDRFELKLETGIAALKGKEVWLRLPEEEQTRILANPSLRPYQRPSLSGPRDLHDALNQRSLAQWDAVIDALPERLSQAELEAIRVLKPKVKEVVLDKPLMEKPADVERWIEQTRETLLELVSDGQPVRIK